MSKHNVNGCHDCPAYAHNVELMQNSCGLDKEIQFPETLFPFSHGKPYDNYNGSRGAPSDCPLRRGAITLTFQR